MLSRPHSDDCFFSNNNEKDNSSVRFALKEHPLILNKVEFFLQTIQEKKFNDLNFLIALPPLETSYNSLPGMNLVSFWRYLLSKTTAPKLTLNKIDVLKQAFNFSIQFIHPELYNEMRMDIHASFSFGSSQQMFVQCRPVMNDNYNDLILINDHIGFL